MNIILITFQINTLENGKTVIENIKKVGPWARITKTTYCVKVNGMTAKEIRDRLMPIIENECYLFVVEITKSSWGSYRLPEAVTNWLKNN